MPENRKEHPDENMIKKGVEDLKKINFEGNPFLCDTPVNKDKIKEDCGPQPMSAFERAILEQAEAYDKMKNKIAIVGNEVGVTTEDVLKAVRAQSNQGIVVVDDGMVDVTEQIREQLKRGESVPLLDNMSFDVKAKRRGTNLTRPKKKRKKGKRTH